MIFRHNLALDKHARDGRWLHKNLPKWSSFKGAEVPPRTAPLINVGGFLAMPFCSEVHIAEFMTKHTKCNDQISINMGVHEKMINVTDKNNAEHPMR